MSRLESFLFWFLGILLFMPGLIYLLEMANFGPIDKFLLSLLFGIVWVFYVLLRHDRLNKK